MNDCPFCHEETQTVQGLCAKCGAHKELARDGVTLKDGTVIKISSTGSNCHKEKPKPFYIGYLCEECPNVSGKPPMLFGYETEGEERFGCHHKVKKVRVFESDEGRRFEPAQEGDPEW
jgi:hypothetical protein